MTTAHSFVGSYPLGLYEKALPSSLDWEQRLAQARAIGFDFVELSVDDSDARIARLDWSSQLRAGMRRAMRAAGIPILSLSLSAHRRFPLGSKDPSTRQKAIDLFFKAIDLALDLGMRYVLVAGAEDYYGERDSECQARFRDALGQVLERSSGAGLMLALENWDNQIDSLAKVMAYVDYFNSPWFQVYADIGNLVYAGRDVLAELELARGHIAALHVKDVRPDDFTSVRLGEGEVPLDAAFTKLAEIGFHAPVVLELFTGDQPDAMERVRMGYTVLNRSMKAGRDAYRLSFPNREVMA